MFFFINPVLVRAAFVSFAFSLAGATSDEDDHSRFSYDHQMLYKIVKLEQKVEQMDNKLEASLESFLAILQYRKDKNNVMKTQGDSLTGNLTEFKKEKQEMYGVPKIAFSAKSPSSSTYFPDQVLILRNSSLNEGSGYNGTTGEFTAPLAGLYLFIAHICPHHQNWAHIAIVVGSKEVAQSANLDQDANVCSSVSAVTNGQKGERVFLKATAATKLFTDAHRQSSFTGVRLSN